MPKAGRPLKFPIKKLVGLDQVTMSALEKAQGDEKDDPNTSEIIRRILKDWLIGHGYIDLKD